MKTRQSRKASLIEICASVAVGFIIALIVQRTLMHYYSLPSTFRIDFEITIIFTIVSILRGYAFRRIFEYLRVKNILE